MNNLKEEMPAAEPNGFIKTLNNMGYMTSTLDSYSEAFTDFASRQSGWSLDVGAAYGIATKSAITKGAQIVANDICAEHLDIIEADIGDKFGPSFRKAPGDFLNQKINPDSLAAILACRVLHFYTGEKIEVAASLFYSWLNRNGRVFIVCETPYLSNFQTFIPTFEERKRAGIKWPGFINDVQAVYQKGQRVSSFFFQNRIRNIDGKWKIFRISPVRRKRAMVTNFDVIDVQGSRITHF